MVKIRLESNLLHCSLVLLAGGSSTDPIRNRNRVQIKSQTRFWQHEWRENYKFCFSECVEFSKRQYPSTYFLQSSLATSPKQLWPQRSQPTPGWIDPNYAPFGCTSSFNGQSIRSNRRLWRAACHLSACVWLGAHSCMEGEVSRIHPSLCTAQSEAIIQGRDVTYGDGAACSSWSILMNQDYPERVLDFSVFFFQVWAGW